MAELTDAIVRFSGEFPILSYMTSNGDKTFVIYQISILDDDSEQVTAELFDTSDGKFVSLAKYVEKFDIPVVGFNEILSGGANKDLTRFTIVKSSPNNKFIVTSLSYNKALGKLVTDVVSEQFAGLSEGFTTLGGTFAYSDNLLAITTVDPASPSPTSQDSFIYLLDSVTLKQVHKQSVKSTVFTYLPLPVDCRQDSYIVVPSAKGVFDFNDVAANWKPPFALESYYIQKTGSTYKLVKESSQKLSQGAYYVSIVKRSSKKWSVAVGTSLAILPNERTIILKTDDNKAAPDTSGDEIALFWLNCDGELCEDCSYNANMTVDSVINLPKKDTLVFSQQSPDFTSTLQFGRLGEDSCCLTDLSFASPIGIVPTYATSKTNDILVVASASNADLNQNNLLLYRIY